MDWKLKILSGVVVLDVLLSVVFLSASNQSWDNVNIKDHFDHDVGDVALLTVCRGLLVLLVTSLAAGPGLLAGVLVSVGAFAYSCAKAAELDDWSGLQSGVVISAIVGSAIEASLLATTYYLHEEEERVEASKVAMADAEGGPASLNAPLLEQDEEGGKEGKDTNQQKSGANGSKSVTFSRLMGLAKPERKILLVATMALLFSTLSNLAIPSFIGQLIDGVVESDDRGRLDRSCLILLLVFVVGSIFTSVRGVLFNYSGERLVKRLRVQLFQSISCMDMAWFDEQKTGELMNRLSSDTTVVQNAATVNISMGLRSLASVLLSMILLFFTSWRLSLVMMAVVPLIVGATRVYGAFAKGISKNYQNALAGSAEVASEALGSVRTVRSFGAEPREMRRYANKVEQSYALGVKKACAYGVFMGGVGLLAYLAMLCVLWYGGRLVLKDQLSAGSLTAFLLYTVYIATGLGTLSGLFSEFMTALGASERVFELIDRRPAVPISGGLTPATPPIGHLVFENVSFSYPARPDVEVLKDFSLNIRPRETVALVGHSGAGKSTVLSLLERFYDVSGGRILMDGYDVSELDPVWLRSTISLVQQEPVLFSGSVLDNICYGCFSRETGLPRQISREAVEEAAALAHCHDFIMDFPDGYDTMIGERGVRLSGGQKQRVAIARALLVNPRFLLLDEATSALDAESEHLVQQAIETIMRDRTTIVIAHRLSTIRNADKIVVFSQGRIKAIGRHAELLETSKVYKKLVQRQLQVEAVEEEGGGEEKEQDSIVKGSPDSTGD